MSSHTRILPHWHERPPDGYPFEVAPLHFEPAMLPRAPELQELKIIHERGKELLGLRDYQDALWKFENCLLIADTSEEIVKHASNCALALLKLYSEDQVKKKKALEHCKRFCGLCLEQYVEPKKLQKVRNSQSYIHIKLMSV